MDAILARQRSFKARVRLADFAAAKAGWAQPTTLVTGFWRSGTTWLQETLATGLCAKTIFEPLSPQIPRYRALIGAVPLASEAARHAYIPRLSAQDRHGLWTHLDEAFKGHCPGDAALICRRRLGESLLRRTVVKCVRMQFSVAAIQARYAVPVIHIRRQPVAVAASLLRARWGWSFAEVTLRELFEAHGDGLQQLVDPAAVDQALRLYDTDPLSRIAAYWAVTEAAVEAQLKPLPRTACVEYERLLEDPAGQLQQLCGRLGLTLRSPLEWERDSPVTDRSSAGAAPESRRDAWRGVLGRADASRVTKIADAILGPVLNRPRGARPSAEAADA